MKKGLLLVLVFCGLFFKTYSKGQDAKKVSIYDYAYEGIHETYKDYKNNPRFYVNGPFNTDGLAKELGWKKRYTVGPNGDSWSNISYLENGRKVIIRSVDIEDKIDGWYLSKYIGEPKSKILEDFPLGPEDLDKGFVIFYSSDERMIVSISVKDEIITHINISARLE